MTSRQCGREINLPAGAPDPSIKFVILISDQLLVVHTHSVKNCLPKGSERNCVDESLFTTCSELGVTDSEWTAQDRCDERCTEALVSGNGQPRSSNIVSACFEQTLHAVRRIIRRVDIVSVGSNDNLSTRGPDSYIHCRGNDARRVVQAKNLWILFTNLFNDFARSI